MSAESKNSSKSTQVKPIKEFVIPALNIERVHKKGPDPVVEDMDSDSPVKIESQVMNLGSKLFSFISGDIVA